MIERGYRWCRRRPAIAALSVSLTLSLFAGLLGILILWREAEAERVRAETESARAEQDFQAASDALNQLA